MATYLNDHLAGSVGAIEMIKRLMKAYEGKRIEEFFKQLYVEINSDQDDLRELMRALEVKESHARRVAAWMGEKLIRPKIRLLRDETRSMGLFQALEALVLGIKGKEALWHTLLSVTETWPPLKRFSLQRLKQRAMEQGDQVEAKRLEVSRQVFA